MDDVANTASVESRVHGGEQDTLEMAWTKGESTDEVLTRTNTVPTYKVYKRRFFGLLQLVLLNIIISWDVSSSSRYTTIYYLLILYYLQSRRLTIENRSG